MIWSLFTLPAAGSYKENAEDDDENEHQYCLNGLANDLYKDSEAQHCDEQNYD
jgi:hypothetical protein